MTATTKVQSKRRGPLTETVEEFCVRVGADKPLKPEVWARVKAIFEAPLPPAAPGTEGRATDA